MSAGDEPASDIHALNILPTVLGDWFASDWHLASAPSTPPRFPSYSSLVIKTILGGQRYAPGGTLKWTPSQGQ